MTLPNTSNYPNGFAGGVTIRNTPVLNVYGGNCYWVDSVAGADGNKGSFVQPFATLGRALQFCSANNGDAIFLNAGHAETVSAAGGINVNVAGVSVVGLGVGNARPTFTFATSTAATFLMSAANCSVQNVVGTTTVDQIVSPFVISGANCYLDLDWQDGSSVLEALRAVLTTAAADNLSINLKYTGFTAGSHCVNGVRLVGADTATININAYGKPSTAWVEFVTTACTNVEVYGYMYVSGTTNFTKDVVDTVTGSTWFASFFDGAAASSVSGGSGAALASDDVSTVASNMNVPTADSTANTLERDVVGNKTDTAVYVPGTTKSQTAYAKGTADLQEKVAFKAAALLTTGMTLFTVAGGPIEIMALAAVCVVGGDSTAATLLYSVTPTSGSAQAISGASASLANAAAGASVTLAGTALATAALYNANGPNLIANPGTIFAPAGTITATIGSGPTATGTWAFYIRYRPLATGVTVS